MLLYEMSYGDVGIDWFPNAGADIRRFPIFSRFSGGFSSSSLKDTLRRGPELSMEPSELAFSSFVDESSAIPEELELRLFRPGRK
jgi:hypothetical protein